MELREEGEGPGTEEDGAEDDTDQDAPDNINGGNIDEQTEEEAMDTRGGYEDGEDELSTEETIVGGGVIADATNSRGGSFTRRGRRYNEGGRM